MKRFVYLALCLFVVLSLSSCFMTGAQDNCDHEWETVITGGQINISSTNVQSVGKACTVVKTCTKCGAKEGSNVNPTLGLSYSGTTVAFDSNCTERSIVLPEKVKEADAEPVALTTVGSFADCYLLTSIVIPDSVETIDAGAFSCCYNLEEITLPAGFEFNETDHNGLFAGCYSLKKVLPEKQFTDNSEYFYDSYILLDKYEITL